MFKVACARAAAETKTKFQRRFCYLRLTDSNDDISWAIKASPCHAQTMINNRYFVLYNLGQSPILNINVAALSLIINITEKPKAYFKYCISEKPGVTYFFA